MAALSVIAQNPKVISVINQLLTPNTACRLSERELRQSAGRVEYGDVTGSTEVLRREKRADVPAILKTGIYKLKYNDNTVLAAA